LALSAKGLIVPALVGTAGAVLVELGRRERSPVLYVCGAGILAWTVVGTARAILGHEDTGGSVVHEPAPGYVEV
jgi:hypothetical protein